MSKPLLPSKLSLSLKKRLLKGLLSKSSLKLLLKALRQRLGLLFAKPTFEQLAVMSASLNALGATIRGCAMAGTALIAIIATIIASIVTSNRNFLTLFSFFVLFSFPEPSSDRS